MAREFSRTQRVGEQIQRDLARLIPQEVKDPRLGLVTVNEVRVARDFSFADVYVTVMTADDSDEAKVESVQILNRAAGYLRSLIGREIRLRVVPQLRFHYDRTVVEGNRLARLIEQAVAADRSRQQEDGED